MSDQEKKRSKKYNRVREKFEELPLEEKATFLIEAMFTTITRGIEETGKAFSDELNSLFRQARERAEQRAEEQEHDENEAPEPTEEASSEPEAAEEAKDASGDESAEEEDRV